MSNKVIIISGDKGTGKTTTLDNIAKELISKGTDASGFTAPAIITNGNRDSYNIKNIKTGTTIMLCTSREIPGYQKIKSFWFNPEAIKYGSNILLNSTNNIIIIDEIGPMELQKQVWHSAFAELLQKKYIQLIISVRTSLISTIISNYSIKNYSVFTAGDRISTILDELSSI